MYPRCSIILPCVTEFTIVPLSPKQNSHAARAIIGHSVYITRWRTGRCETLLPVCSIPLPGIIEEAGVAARYAAKQDYYTACAVVNHRCCFARWWASCGIAPCPVCPIPLPRIVITVVTTRITEYDSSTTGAIIGDRMIESPPRTSRWITSCPGEGGVACDVSAPYPVHSNGPTILRTAAAQEGAITEVAVGE